MEGAASVQLAGVLLCEWWALAACGVSLTRCFGTFMSERLHGQREHALVLKAGAV